MTRTRPKHFIWFLAGFFLLFSALTVNAEENIWQLPGSKTTPAAEMEEWISNGGQLTGDALFGRMLFNSSSLMGERAVRIGLTCASCHPAGHKNDTFFIPGLSDKPGRIDLTHGFWHDAGEDGVFNPKTIPTLRDVGATAPYGKAETIPDLEQFTRFVIEAEFGGPRPKEYEMKALLAYLNRLASANSDEATILKGPLALTAYLDLLREKLDANEFEASHRVAELFREILGQRFIKAPKPSYASVSKLLSEFTKKAAPHKEEAAYLIQQIQQELQKAQ